MADRVHLRIEFETALPPDRVIGALTDFSDERLRIWPGIDPDKYRLHERGDGWARVTEGNRDPDIWAVERYDWTAERVVIRAEESNFCLPGDGTELVITPNARGGSDVILEWEREAASPEWQPLMDAMAEGGETMLRMAYRDRFEALAREG